MNAHDLRRTDADDEDLLACLVGDLADEVLEAAAGAAAAQLGTWVNCTPIWWCPGVSGETKPPRIGPVGEDSRNELLAASRVMVGGTRGTCSLGDHVMPIYRRFLGAPFDPEHITLMDAAFAEVCRDLGLARRDDAFCDIIADAVLACARRGIRDPIEMRRCARDVLQVV